VHDAEKRLLLRGLFDSTARIRPDAEGSLLAELLKAETRLLTELRRATEEDVMRRIRFAVSPVFTAVVGPPG